MNTEAFEKVADGVLVYRHNWADGTCTLVFGDNGMVAIDGGGDVADGEVMAACIRTRGFEPARLIYTHGHSDHVWGAMPLGLGEVIAHDKTAHVMRSQLSQWAGKWQASAEVAASRVSWPTLTFSEELGLHLGGKRSLRLLRTPGHSADGISVMVEDCRVLIAGDCAATGIVPALGDGDGRILEASLRMLLDIDIDVLVPGHGPVVRGPQVADWLRWGADYLLGVRERVQQLMLSGVPLEQIAEAVPFEQFVGTRLPRDQHGMPGRHAAAVAKVIAEEQTRLPKPHAQATI